MSLFAKHIDLAKVLDVSVLSNRATARYLFENKIEKSLSPKIRLDFKDVEFASRSFLDELNYHLKEKRFVSIEKINMNDQVLKMDHLVRRDKNTIKSNFRSENKERELLSI